METPYKAIAEYEITYHQNGFVQRKYLISYLDYESIIKPAYSKIADLEITNSRENKNIIQKIKKQLKLQFGEQWFLDRSPLFDAIETGIIKLPKHQGGEHKVTIVKI